MIQALFFIPVGPKDTQRAAATVRSIRQFCADYKIFLLLDGPRAESLPPEINGADVSIQENPHPSLGHWGKIWQMQCLAMVRALADSDVAAQAIFVKIDADALVVRAGLVERAQALFRSRPRAGQIGQCFCNILGARLPNRGWANFYQKMYGWRGLYRFTQSSLRQGAGLTRGRQTYQRFRALLDQAHGHGYVDGEFAIGGSYLLRREVVAALATPGLLEDTPFLHLASTGEDGVMTVYVYASGYAAMDDIADGGIFAVEGKAFRIDPLVLKERGHYILHPTKYGHELGEGFISEEQLVELLLR